MESTKDQSLNLSKISESNKYLNGQKCAICSNILQIVLYFHRHLFHIQPQIDIVKGIDIKTSKNVCLPNLRQNNKFLTTFFDILREFSGLNYPQIL